MEGRKRNANWAGVVVQDYNRTPTTSLRCWHGRGEKRKTIQERFVRGEHDREGVCHGGGRKKYWVLYSCCVHKTKGGTKMTFFDMIFRKRQKFVPAPRPYEGHPFEKTSGKVDVTYLRTETERERHFTFEFYGWEQLMDKLKEYQPCDKMFVFFDEYEAYGTAAMEVFKGEEPKKK